MKKLLKNKILVLAISVAILSIVYFVAQKAIDSYVFNSNGDIVSEGEADFNSGGSDAGERDKGEEVARRRF